jgi:putative NADH-flavin reductase
MKVLIIGASGATGHWLVRGALAQGRQVTAFVRNPDAWKAPEGVRVAKGDARDAASLDAALAGQDAVLSAFGPRSMRAGDLQETFMRNLVTGMRKQGVRRLVNLSALGMGDSVRAAPFLFRAVILPLFLRNVFADKARGEALLFAGGLDYVNVCPGRLLNSPAKGGVKASLDGKDTHWTMSREDLAGFMLAQLGSDVWLGKSVLIGY